VVYFEAAAAPLPWPFVSRGRPAADSKLRGASQWAVGDKDVPSLITGLRGYQGIEPKALGASGAAWRGVGGGVGRRWERGGGASRGGGSREGRSWPNRPSGQELVKTITPTFPPHPYLPIPPPPASSVKRGTSAAPTFETLSLPGAAGMTLASACCRERTYPTTAELLADEALVVRSNLQAVFVGSDGDVTAYVTDSQTGRPVAGAKVALYYPPSGNNQVREESYNRAAPGSRVVVGV
jgi:hypothetical protein